MLLPRDSDSLVPNHRKESWKKKREGWQNLSSAFIHSFPTHLLSSCYMPNTVPEENLALDGTFQGSLNQKLLEPDEETS